MRGQGGQGAGGLWGRGARAVGAGKDGPVLVARGAHGRALGSHADRRTAAALYQWPCLCGSGAVGKEAGSVSAGLHVTSCGVACKERPFPPYCTSAEYPCRATGCWRPR